MAVQVSAPFSFEERKGQLYVVPRTKVKRKKSPSIADHMEVPTNEEWIGNTKFVVVESRQHCLAQLYQSAGDGGCVLVEGVGGCGKTSLVKMLSERWAAAQRRELVVLHMGEQIDSKVLLGTFTCTGVPGEFVWMPGLLTQCVTEGKWMLLEDIDHAPADVLSQLLPLVKSGQLVVPGYCEPLVAANGFKMFLTRRLGQDGRKLFVSGSSLLSVLEGHVTSIRVPQYSKEEIVQILSSLYPAMESLVDQLVSTLTQLTGAADLRKLRKLCDRLHPSIHNGRLTNIDDCLMELVEGIAGHLIPDKKLECAQQLAILCGSISKDKVEYLCLHHKPAVQVAKTTFTVGRAYLPRTADKHINFCYAHTRFSLSLLESVCRCVQLREPVLLVGETGVGKTISVSYLAAMTGNKLVTVNMSQQSDSTDLLGGFKPVDVAGLMGPLHKTFLKLFSSTFDSQKNKEFLRNIQGVVARQEWKKLVEVMLQTVKLAKKKFTAAGREKSGTETVIVAWDALERKLLRMNNQLERPHTALAFAFVEGVLVEAVKHGWWVLLDEVNLASPEALQCLSSLLEGPQGSFLLTEQVNCEPVERHPNFHLFCCMNPATDVGKRSLPPYIRDRFTEVYVAEPCESSDLRTLVLGYLSGQPSLTPAIVEGIIKFYSSVRQLADNKLEDGTGRRPHYSLRTLCRALSYAASNYCNNFLRSLYEGTLMAFLTQLRIEHHPLIAAMIQQHLSIPDSCINAGITRPRHSTKHVQVEGLWLAIGSEEPDPHPPGYVLTPSVKRNLKNLARVVSGSRYPVLLQGPTSAGKTSLIQYLARLTGHKCLRINNHEHTDLQEYVGMYSANAQGQLEFQEGVLVEAMRNGHWVILDELNLAPTDVLEALNRVLDDNRELFIPETQQLVRAHPRFMLFGTQNPPGVYGGRKVLSRAFRNRFIELHYNDIPHTELVTILHQRCALPQSYGKKMVTVLKDLQQRRSLSGVFEGKYGLITLRDLFRWAERYRRSLTNERFYDWEQQLAEDGYLLLAGRLRTSQEEATILEVIQKRFKCSLEPQKLFGGSGGLTTRESLQLLRTSSSLDEFCHLVWTPQLLRMAILVHRAVSFDEPVLLVGHTGSGKTTLCQLLARLLQRKLFSINCHMHTEAADFLGGLRPIRNRNQDASGLFEWCDGVVVEAMKEGGCVLVDEISLADDAVLERLNSVLETDRKLLVAERGKHKEQVYEVTAKDGFVFMATMNPGGDYGKKELSPALRNRFVEIWCPDTCSRHDHALIINHNISPDLKDCFPWADMMLDFVDWLRKQYSSSRFIITTRDILSWVRFVNSSSPTLSPSLAFYHGAHLVFVDGLGCGGGGDRVQRLREACYEYLMNQVEVVGEVGGVTEIENGIERFGIKPFFIDKGPVQTVSTYCLTAAGPASNAFRLLRAMQLGRPLMLEGEPGVGKTSLVTALAAASGHHVTRINLSEHTDISDLFGSDLPVEGAGEVRFAWRDGPFLKALKSGDWILLDEMNLASQSVLEGLNACLDHRGDVYIPELSRSFQVQRDTHLFACQNPLHQGGGRKGLPRSLVNRFTQVMVEAMSAEDLVFIATSLFPTMDKIIVQKMVTFNNKVGDIIGYHGNSTALWEFNLRDILRWCELIVHCGGKRSSYDPVIWVHVIYLMRLRSSTVRHKVVQLYNGVFYSSPNSNQLSAHSLGQFFHISSSSVQIGSTQALRGYYNEQSTNADPLFFPPCQLSLLEALLQCVQRNWMAILVGGECSGKSTLVHLLARLIGRKLLEFPMNCDTDVMELVGGFDQVSQARQLSNIASTALYSIKCLATAADRKETRTVTDLNSIISSLQEMASPAVGQLCEEELAGVSMTQCVLLRELIAQSVEIAVALEQPLLEESLEKAGQEVDQLCESGTATAGQFEWVDSLLVQAMKHGHWLVISHANFCSPSVLDRLNPLLEPGGVLSIDERGIVGDSIPVVHPHPDFRLFLTMDPAHGELSRAMRNRGIEIFILPEEVKLLHQQLITMTTDTCCPSPTVDELISQPAVSVMRRELFPVVDCLNNIQQTTQDPVQLSSVRQFQASLRVFVEHSTRDDIELRSCVLHQLAKRASLPSLLQSELLAAGDALVAMATSPALLDMCRVMEALNGGLFEGHIIFTVNTHLYQKIQSSDAVQFLNQKKISLQLIAAVTWMKGLISHTRTSSHANSSRACFLQSATNLLPAGTGVRVTVLLNQLLEGIVASADTLIAASIDMNQLLNVLWMFILLCVHPEWSLPVVAVWWRMVHQHCLSAVLPLLSSHLQNSLQHQLSALAPMNELISSETQLLNTFRRALGGLQPPSSLQSMQLKSAIGSKDSQLVRCSTRHQPLRRLDSNVVQKRGQLLSSLCGCHDVEEGSSILPQQDSEDAVEEECAVPSPVLHPAAYCVTNLAMHCPSTNSDVAAPLLDYCLGVPSIDLEMLHCLENMRDNQSSSETSLKWPSLQLMELACVGSLPCQGEGGGDTSLLDLCMSVLQSPEQENSKLTSPATVSISNYPRKLKELNTMLQFLCLYGLSPSSSQRATTSQGVQWITHLTHMVCGHLVSAAVKCGLYSCEEHLSLANAYSACVEILQGLSASRVCRWDTVLQLLEVVWGVIVKCDNGVNGRDLSVDVAMGRCHLGLVLALLLCPSQALDPLMVDTAQQQLYQLMSSHCQQLLDAYAAHHCQLYSVATHTSSFHAHTHSWLQQAQYWSAEEKAHTTTMLPPRILSHKYGALTSTCTELTTSICSRERVTHLMKATNSGDQVTSWRVSVAAAANRLRVEFPSFPDLVQPFTAALSMVASGLKDLSSSANPHSLYTTRVETCIIQYPYWDGGELGRVSQLVHYCKELWRNKQDFTMCRSIAMVTVETLLHYVRYQKQQQQQSHYTLLSPFVLDLVKQVFSLCQQLWFAADERRREKEAEEESMYQFKPRTFEISEREEDIMIERELQQLFPSFEAEFQNDEERTNQLENDYCDRVDQLPSSLPSSFSQFTDDEMQLILSLHLATFTSSLTPSPHSPSTSSLTSSPHSPSTSRILDVVRQLQQRQEMEGGTSPCDGLVVGGLARMCHQLTCHVTSSDVLPRNRCFDIYRDSMVHEAKRALPVLQSLVKHVEQVLMEWPDYPVLLQIKSACEKVLSLSLDEPLMKILTGLEHVLKKAQDWEAYASSRLSLSVELQSLTNLILDWRKQELSCWSQLLQLCAQTQQVTGSKWWFQLQSLCRAHTEGEDSSADQLILSLHKFMESASLGEYSIRLCMLEAFGKEMRGSSVTATAALLNSYGYYHQFLPAVETAIDNLASPVEKEFKEYLKILRWNDGNYWAIRQATIRSHRSLVKYMNKYKDILAHPVQPVLSTTSMVKGEEEVVTEESRLDQLVRSLSAAQWVSQTAVMMADDGSNLLTVPITDDDTLTAIECYHRMQQLVGSYSTHCLPPVWCGRVNDLAEQIAATYQELQATPTSCSTEVKSQTTEEDKIKSAVKLIMMRRKRALSDLIQLLREVGLSHRKGEECTEDFQLVGFSIPTITPENSSLEGMADGEKYYYRCIARYVALQSALSSPSKELSSVHISRCWGYTRHLMKLLCEQRTALSTGLRNHSELRHLLGRIRSACESNGGSCSPQHYCKWQSTLVSLIEQSLSAVSSLEELVTMIPAECDLTLTPFHPSLLSPLVTGSSHHDSQQLLSSMTKKMEQLLQAVLRQEHLDSYFITGNELKELVCGYHGLLSLAEEDISSYLQLVVGDQCCGMLDFLEPLKSTIQQQCAQFFSWVESIFPDHGTSISPPTALPSEVEKVMVKVMLGVQQVMAHHKEQLKSNKKQEEEGSDQSDILLCKTLHEVSLRNVYNMKTSDVICRTKQLLQLVAASHSIEGVLLSQALPVLDQYALLHCRLLDQLSLSYRTMGKLLSILLVVFTNLFSKGFCTPPELDQSDEAGEGTEFVDIEAGGFDDGEGMKNVSKDAEKDNLDGGGPQPNPEKQKEKEEGEEEAVEMEEDFEGAMEDLPERKEECGSESEEDENEGDIDQKMGELDGEQQLDKNMWAPEGDQSDELEEGEGEGAGCQEEDTQLVAKESEDSGRKKQQDKPEMGGGDEELSEGEVDDKDEYFDQEQKEEKEKHHQHDTKENEFEMLDLDEEQDSEEEESGSVSGESGEEEAADNGVDETSIEEEEGRGTEREDEGPGQYEPMEEEFEKDEEEEDNEVGTGAKSSEDVYGIHDDDQLDHSNEQNNVHNTATDKEISDRQEQQSTEDPNSISGSVTNTVTERDGTVLPTSTSSSGKKPTSRRRKKTFEDLHRTPSMADHQRPVKRARLYDSQTETVSSEDQNTGKVDKESDCYQHVTESQASDAVAWDTAEAGVSGLQEAAMEDEDDDRENGQEGADEIGEEKVSLGKERLNVMSMLEEAENGDNVDSSQDDEEKEEVMDVEDTSLDKELPVDSFFASGDAVGMSNIATIDEQSLRESLSTAVEVLHSQELDQDCAELWMKYELLTANLSHDLCEQLRMILEPTRASQLKGDFRTGKRLNMRRLIPYIASNFQNDRIWLRRSKPSKRDYQVLLAVDDSSSMCDNRCSQMAYESLALISTALHHLDCGQLGVCRFGEGVEVLHSLDQPFSSSSGSSILQHLSFSQGKTNFVQLLQTAEAIFSRCLLQGRQSTTDISQLLLVLSDGRGVFADGVMPVESAVRRLTGMGVFLVFVILDGLSKDSIVDIRVPTFKPGQAPIINTYLETFPFPFYIVLREVEALPSVLGQALRQWFQLVSSQASTY